ncbi:protease inhibitor I42 family protein [Pseudobacteroides cellulosolvens]|uniref:Proteinase inhibitor I42, chagasin n=1 Tax=Pseudobacteroides cellulosolvens ATCC 35603 = DSM 2933 TaxID=398512 RepID=A0A0L6JJ94_9FIRM|nr:protease inhibitor I42 family protein [Pseudobacteroides cellulosolvens]KNY25805.1 Proteinase inhibitor I42, chagasin [Pseudobacteroides cellulosolvens ATCC 35603 = DSM 2933]
MKRILLFLVTMLFFVSSLTGFAAKPATKGIIAKTVTITGEITKLNPGVPYNKEMLAVKTSDQSYLLVGQTSGMNKYIGYSANITGTITKGPQGIMMFNVKSYKLIGKTTPTPTLKPTATAAATATSSPVSRYVTLQGYLYNLNSDMSKFYLKTETGISELIGNTKGMETAVGNMVEVVGNYVQTLVATEYPPFNVVSYNVIPAPTSTSVPPVKYVTLKGNIFTQNSDMSKFYLKTENGPYELIGNTKGMETAVGNFVEVNGNYVATLVATEYPLFSVISYKVIATPSPSSAPAYKEITIEDNGGYAYVKKGDELRLTLESNATTGYKWSYVEKPDANVLVETSYNYIPDPSKPDMVGVGGKEVWTYKAIADGIAKIDMVYSRPWESVTPYKSFVVKVMVGYPAPTPTPELQYIQGTLFVKETYPLTYELKTQDCPYTLKGNTDGMEKYANMQVEVCGNVSPLKIYPPIFNVVSYKVLPEPTPITDPKVHTIISEKPLFFSEKSVGSIGSPESLSGSTTLSWKEGSKTAFFNSRITVSAKEMNINYEIELIETISSTRESIAGLFNIIKDGTVIAKGVKGEVYGLTLNVGDYFKFYSQECNLNLASYITQRLDF